MHKSLSRLIGLNRTFYGIETIKFAFKSALNIVLIVPFMELKRDRINWS